MATKHNWQDHRLSSSVRGYGRDWQKLRLRVLAAEPLCRFCAKFRQVTVATEVDHIEPFKGIDDPLRLDPTNCRPLCGRCHDRRSAQQAAGDREGSLKPPIRGLRGFSKDGWPIG